MALKKRITKEEHAALAAHFKTEYIEDGDGFRLDIEGGEEDTGALKRAKDRESQLRREAEAKLKQAQDALDALGTDDAKKKGDIATLEKAWQKTADETKAAYEARIGKLTAHTTKTLVDNVAAQIAHKISTAPALMLPHIKARLQADFEGDEPVTKVLGADGKVSALTLDQLQAEFVANKDFSSIIVASKASGGAGKQTTVGGAANNQQQQPADLSKLSPAALAAQLKEGKAAAE
jgi:hypothetical protein